MARGGWYDVLSWGIDVHWGDGEHEEYFRDGDMSWVCDMLKREHVVPAESKVRWTQDRLKANDYFAIDRESVKLINCTVYRDHIEYPDWYYIDH